MNTNGLKHAVKMQQATIGHPAAQAAAGNMVTSMQNQVSPYAPSHIKNAIEFGIQQGHAPMHILNTVHTLLSRKGGY